MAYPYFNQNPYFQPTYYGAMPDILNQQKASYQPSQSQNNELLWVLGQTEAESYPVAPNNTVVLWDKNQPTIYVKSVNAQGIPSMRILDFEERILNAPKTAQKQDLKSTDNFVTLEQFKALEGKFDEVKGIVDGLKAKPSKKYTKESDE